MNNVISSYGFFSFISRQFVQNIWPEIAREISISSCRGFFSPMQATTRYTINFSGDNNPPGISDRFTILTHIWGSSFSMRVGIESERNETKRNEGGDSTAVAAAAIPDAIARKTRHANAKRFRIQFSLPRLDVFGDSKNMKISTSRIQLFLAFFFIKNTFVKRYRVDWSFGKSATWLHFLGLSSEPALDYARIRDSVIPV